MAERNVTFLILAKDFASRVMKNVGDSTDRTAQKLRNLNVIGLGPLATTAAALGPALLPMLGAATVGAVGLGAAFVSAGAAVGVFGAVFATTFKEVADASKKSDDLRDKIRLLNQEISMAPFGTVKQSTLIKSRDKALLEYRARLALLPAPTRAAVMALDNLKTAWQNFVDSVKPGTLSIMTRGFDLLASIIPKLRPLFIAGAQAANELLVAIQGFVNRGGLDRFIGFMASRALPTLEKFGGIAVSLGAGFGYLLAPFLKTTDGIVNGIDRLSLSFAGWARGPGAAGVQRIIDYVNRNGGSMGELLMNLAISIGTLAQAAAPLAPVSLAVANALTQLINAIPQPLLTGIIASFIAWSVAMQGAMVVTRVVGAVGILAGVITGLTTAMVGGTLATEANTAARVAYAIATGIGTAATTLFAGAVWLANAALAVLLSPITLIVLGVAALVVGVILAYKHITVFRNAVDAVGRAIAGAAQWIAGAFMTAVRAIPGIVQAVVNFFVALPGRILSALIAFPGMYIRFWKFVLEQGAYWVAFGIGRTIRFFINLPGQVQRAVIRLLGWIASFWQSVWNRGITLAVAGSRAIVNWFRQLPGRAASAISSLGARVGAFFRSAWNSAVSLTVNGVNRAVTFFRSLPGKAASALSSLPGRIRGAFSGAASWLVSAGADIVRGLVRGITGMLGSAVNEAKRIAGNIVSGFKHGLGIGSPSRVMAKEVGRWIPPGILAGLQAAMPGLLRGVGRSMNDVTNAAVANGTGNFDFGVNGSGVSAAVGAGTGNGMTVVVNVSGALDPNAVGRQIVSILERWANTQGKHFELAQ